MSTISLTCSWKWKGRRFAKQGKEWDQTDNKVPYFAKKREMQDVRGDGGQMMNATVCTGRDRAYFFRMLGLRGGCKL